MIDAMLRQMQAIGKLDIDGYLGYIRHQRNYLIQTLDQYIFVHDVLLEAVSRRMVVQPPPEIFSPSAAVSGNHPSVQIKMKNIRHVGYIGYELACGCGAGIGSVLTTRSVEENV